MLPDGPHIVVKRSPEDAELLRRIRENPITYEELLALAKESTKKP